ncbi:MAG: acyl carrier protein [Shimia sp.]|uniref:acyl carrier protein n=1 Tax=Shimia sp. TaxID=1954381 RepID=UPI004058E77E
MTIEHRLTEVFDDVLETGENINPSLKRDEYDNWDSLANVTLLMALNAEFGEVVSIDDIARLDSFDSILEFLSGKV